MDESTRSPRFSGATNEDRTSPKDATTCGPQEPIRSGVFANLTTSFDNQTASSSMKGTSMEVRGNSPPPVSQFPTTPMARGARVVGEGVPYHITQRGNSRQDVFRSSEDWRFYLDLLRAKCREHGVRVREEFGDSHLEFRPHSKLAARHTRFREKAPFDTGC